MRPAARQLAFGGVFRERFDDAPADLIERGHVLRRPHPGQESADRVRARIARHGVEEHVYTGPLVVHGGGRP